MIPIRRKTYRKSFDQNKLQNNSLRKKAKSFLSEQISFLFRVFRFFLKLTPFYEKGYNNAIQIKLKKNVFSFDNLPTEFDNLTILHLSDLHVNHTPEIVDKIIQLVDGVSFDLCIITGDFHHKHTRSYDDTISLMKRLYPVLSKARFGIYATIGNHDSLLLANQLENLGITFLINETIEIKQQDDSISITGLEDIHYPERYALEAISNYKLENSFRIIFAHTPEMLRYSESLNGFFLCGHTHGGQVCLPNGKPIILNTSVPLKFSRSRWRFHCLQGYTSFGAGTSGIPIRFNCPPEIALHTLKRHDI